MGFKLFLSVYWLFCFILTHIPGWFFPPGEGAINDKLIHHGMFLVLSVLYTLAFKVENKAQQLRMILVLACYAAFDEISQPIVARDADFLDWLADMSGVLVVLLVQRIRSIAGNARL